jgi:PhnB protein
MAVKPIPEGHHTLTPYLVVADVGKLIEFLQSGFGAEFISPPHKRPDGSIMHAEVKIGDSPVMMGGATAEHKPLQAMLYMYVEDTDAVYERAIAAGATSIMAPMNQFYGDRNAGVMDPCGNQWWIGTHIEDVPPEEIDRRMQEQLKNRSG